MDSLVFAAVLLAAAAHAGWNATIKRGLDPLLVTVLIAIGAGALALPLLLATGLPAAPARPWVIGSVLIHLGYFAGLIEAYRAGDMSQVYPVARGSAPLLTALASTAWLGERLGPLGWIGLLCLVGGVLLLSRRGGDGLKLDRRAVGFALFTALTICGYSVVDGVGARAAGDATAYIAALFVGNAVIMTAYGLARRGPKLLGDMRAVWLQGLAGGGLQLGSYWVVVWAMTVAPIAIVAALRETSVLFGALIAVVILKEPLRALRVAAALLIVAGLVMIRLH
ncbi:MAG TPA: EamA family transporter [Xanthobacteraceae bacterium]